MSLNAIRKLCWQDDLMDVPWLFGDKESKLLPADSIAVAKVLCSRHNLALSPLDAMAGRLLESFDLLHVNRKEGDPNQITYIFDRLDFERWLLKLLCGKVRSRGVFVEGNRVKNWKPPIRWLRILFGYETLSHPCGLYMPNAIVGRKASIWRGGKFASCIADGAVKGLMGGFNNQSFLLAMEDPNTNAPYLNAIYHPHQLIIRSPDFIDKIVFCWKDFVGNSVEITRPAITHLYPG
jgi:hypothetical protein